jgi:hypothetical protein
MNWERCVAHLEETYGHKILVEKPERKISPEKPKNKWKETKKCILNEECVRVFTGLKRLRIGPVAGPWPYSNNHPGSITGREFLDQLSNYQLLKNDSCSVKLVFQLDRPSL